MDDAPRRLAVGDSSLMARQRHKWDPKCPPPRGLVRPSRLDPSGVTGPTSSQARGGKWRRTSYGFYVPSTSTAKLPDLLLPEQRILEQSMRLPPEGAVTGWASCRLFGATFFDGLLPDGRTLIPVPLATGPTARIRGDLAITVLRCRLNPSELVLRHGIACTRARRGLFDAMRAAPDVRESVVAMDMMAAAHVVSIKQMREYLDDHPGWNGAPQVAAALELASEYSKSPNETRMRLIWEIDAGFPRPLVNRPIFDLRGRLLGIADILDPVAGVVGEFDGADHRGASRHSRDVGREDGFRRRGLEYFTVTGPDVDVRRRVVSRMASARSRAKWLPEGERRWTIVAPPGWGRDETLDELLEHRAWMASLHEQ